MVASKDIPAGDIVFVDPALATGPGRNGLPVCISCYQFTDESTYCSKCEWQVFKAPFLSYKDS